MKKPLAYALVSLVGLLIIISGYYVIRTFSNKSGVAVNLPATAPVQEKEKKLGFIYEREKKVSEGGKQGEEFALYDIADRKATIIDTSKPISWRGINGAPVITYALKEVSYEKNVFEISAYDLFSAIKTTIVLGSGFNPYSSISYSPIEKKVAYCADDENVFYVQDIVSGEKKPYPYFSGCMAESSGNAPRFSSDGKSIYYVEFNMNEDRTFSSWIYKKLSLDSGESSAEVSSLFTESNRFDPSRKWYIAMGTFGYDADSYSNQLRVYDFSSFDFSPEFTNKYKTEADLNRRDPVPVISKKDFGTYVHMGDILISQDRSWAFFYTYTAKNRGDMGGDYKIGFFDSEKKDVIYPIGKLPEQTRGIQLLKAYDKNILVFSVMNNITGVSDMYYASAGTNTAMIVDTGVGLLASNKVYFVESK